MPDYKEMYLHLLRASEQAVDLLIAAQRMKLYISFILTLASMDSFCISSGLHCISRNTVCVKRGSPPAANHPALKAILTIEKRAFSAES